MSKVLKVAGKDPNGAVKAIAVDADGKDKVTRFWDSTVHVLVDNGQIREDSPVISTASNSLDLSEYGFVSLRVLNSHDAEVSVMLYEDTAPAGDSWMRRLDGSSITFSVPANSLLIIITPDDIPELNYIKYLKLRISAKTTPTQGSITVEAITKR